jgi:hypothetical protein
VDQVRELRRLRRWRVPQPVGQDRRILLVPLDVLIDTFSARSEG